MQTATPRKLSTGIPQRQLKHRRHSGENAMMWLFLSHFISLFVECAIKLSQIDSRGRAEI